jgi:hypothetical protein
MTDDVTKLFSEQKKGGKTDEKEAGIYGVGAGSYPDGSIGLCPCGNPYPHGS